MNSKCREIFRRQLEQLETELANQDDLGQNSQKTVTLDQQAVGRLSRMDAMQQQAMAKATQARRDQVKTRIAAALKRMNEDEYGYCTECGDDIPTKRLELDPTTPQCISCASG